MIRKRERIAYPAIINGIALELIEDGNDFSFIKTELILILCIPRRNGDHFLSIILIIERGHVLSIETNSHDGYLIWMSMKGG